MRTPRHPATAAGLGVVLSLVAAIVAVAFATHKLHPVTKVVHRTTIERVRESTTTTRPRRHAARATGTAPATAEPSQPPGTVGPQPVTTTTAPRHGRRKKRGPVCSDLLGLVGLGC